MNPHERAILENFLDQLVRVRGTRKIPEAVAMIRRAVDRQPDAAYLLVQRSLMLGQALEDDSLTQIAAECGFVSQSHLSYWFHRIAGERPGQWRRAQARQHF